MANRAQMEGIYIGPTQGLAVPGKGSRRGCLCKDKKLQTRYKLTKDIVAEAYPDITWGNRG